MIYEEIEILRGDAFAWDEGLYELNEAEEEVALDLAATTSDIVFEIRKGKGRESELVSSKKVSNGGISIQEVCRVIYSLSSEETGTLNGLYHYELQLMSLDNTAETWKRGTLKVLNDIAI